MLARIVAKFLVTWLAAIGVLCVLALLTDINWARPFMQNALKETMHRQVQLGPLKWSFGLNGLAVETKKMTVTEMDGRPFLVADRSEIGIAVAPLFKRRLLIRHLQFQNPQVWAVRTGKDRWNFTDLLQGPDIRFVSCDSGHLHLIDRCVPGQKPGWRDLDLEDVKVSFNFPRKRKKTSVFVTFRLPRGKYNSKVELTGLILDKTERWQDAPVDFVLKVDKLNPCDLSDFAVAVAPQLGAAYALDQKRAGGAAPGGALKGLFSVGLFAQGSLAKGLSAHLNAGADDFSICAGAMPTISAPHAVTKCKLFLDEHKLRWSELSLTLGDIVLSSQGELNEWLAGNRSYSADIGGKVQDIKAAAKIVAQQENLPGLKEAEQWSGKAEVQVHLLGSGTDTKCETDLKVEDVLAKNLIERLPAAIQPLLAVLGFRKDAKLRGALKIVPGQSIEVKNAELPLSVGTVKTAGSVDLKNDASSFAFSGTNLTLAPLQTQLDEKLHSNKGAAELPSGAKLRLDGNFDLTGKFASKPESVQSSGEVVLKNVQLALSDRSLAMTGVNGRIDWQSGIVRFKNVDGQIGDGSFTLQGTCGAAANSRLDINLTARHAELAQLETVLSILKLQLPILTERQLYGRVRDLTLKISGTAKSPEIYLSAVPEDVYYQPPGLLRPLRARGGTISYDKDNLVLSDLALAIHNDKVSLTVDIGDVSKAAVVRRVLVKTGGVDLVDVNYYLSSVLMPPPLKKAYAAFLSQYKLSSIHGRTSADLTCVLSGSNVLLDGTTTLTNVGARLTKQFPVEHVTGTVSVTGEQLIFQNLSGTLHDSHFAIDGRISNYKDANAVLALQINATLNPRELVELLPALSDDTQRNIQVKAARRPGVESWIARYRCAKPHMVCLKRPLRRISSI